MNNTTRFYACIAVLAILTAGLLPAAVQQEMEKARTFFSNRQYEQTLDQVASVLRQNSYYRDALLLKGRVYYALAENQKAEQLWLDLYRRDPAYLPTLFTLGQYYLDRKDYERSLRYYRQVLDQDTLNQDAKLAIALIDIRKGLFTDADNLLREVKRINPLNFYLYFISGEWFYTQKKYDEAKEQYLRAKEINPDYAPLYTRLGDLLLKGNDATAAEHYLRQSVALDRRNLSSYSSLADLYLKNREWDKVYEIYKGIEPSFVSSALFYYNLAVIAEKADKVDDVLPSLQKSLKLDSEDPFGRVFYFYRLKDSESGARSSAAGDFFKKAGGLSTDGNYAAALIQLRMGLMLKPDDSRARYLYADCYKRMGLEKPYLKEMAIAADLDQDNEKWQFQLERDQRKYDMKMKGMKDIAPEPTVTKILVVPFDPAGSEINHLDAGLMIARELNIYLNNYNRVDSRLAGDPDTGWVQEAKKHDYVVRGTYTEKDGTLRIKIDLLSAYDLQPVRTWTEAMQDNGRLETVIANSAKKIYTTTPFCGQIFKIVGEDLYVNLGRVDEISADAGLTLFRPVSPAEKFSPNKSNTLGSLRITAVYDDFLVCRPADRTLFKKLRLYDSVILAAPGNGKNPDAQTKNRRP